MKPLTLTMQAFGPYADKETVNFAAIDHGLFLICGPTGSGKTTIFDAVKFALYGQTSAQNRPAREMRSAHASADLPTCVDFVFEHAGREYRINRSPAQVRPKKRGQGVMEAAPEAFFENLTDGVSLASKDSDVTREVISLLGIDADQFSRIVMISQNDFEAVLNTKTKDREVLFRKIFGTDLYARMQDYLENARKSCSEELSALRAYLGAEIERIDRPADDALAAIFDAHMDLDDRPMRAGEFVELLESFVSAQQKEQSLLSQKQSGIRAEIAQVDTLLGKAQIIESARASAAAAQEWLDGHEAELAKAGEDVRNSGELSEQCDELRIKIKSIDAAIDGYDELENTLAQLSRLEREHGSLSGDLELAKRKAAEAHETLASFDTEYEALGNVALRSARITSLLEHKEVEVKGFEELVSLLDNHVKLMQELDARQSELLAAEDSLAQASGKALEAQRLFNADRAGMLAQHLESGMPCPVCGSIEHPHLAKRAAGVPDESHLEELEASLEQTRKMRDAAVQAAASAKTLVSAAEDDLSQKMRTLAPDAPKEPKPYLDSKIADVKSEIQALEADAKSCAKDAQRLDEIDKRRRELREYLETSDDRLAQLQARLSQVNAELAQTRQQHDSLVDMLEFKSKKDAASSRAKLAQTLGALQKDIEAKQNALARLSTEQANQNARLKAARETIQAHDDLHADELASRREELAVLDAQIASKLTMLHALLANHQSCLGKIKKTMDDISAAEERFGQVDVSARLGSGKTAGQLGKMSFETYVQIAYFQRVLQAANERLSIMSQGRYFLVHRQEGRDMRASSGLEIDVLDRYTGSTRPSETLSGGETFLASLSLALGLSDVIMAQAGGMHIDAMFVDEGFGSLDEEACQLAVDVLGKLSSDDRMIGIISHVPDLRQRISRQIQVQKTPSGSTLKLEA